MQSPVNPPIGEIEFVPIANPAAATNFFYLLPNNYLYWLKSIIFTLTTDATAPTRQVRIQTTIAAAVNWWTVFRNPQAASLTVPYSAFPGAFDFTAAAIMPQLTSLPHRHILTANTTIRSEIIAMAVADQISDIVLQFEKWVLQTV